MLPMTCKNESVILVSSKSRSLCEGLLFLCEKIGGGIKMKYCPNCGCELKDEALTCCLECGEPLPVVKKKRKKKKARKVVQEIIDESYDGYYDDRVPVDAEKHQDESDKTLIQNVVLVLLGVVFVISVCIVALYLL